MMVPDHIAAGMIVGTVVAPRRGFYPLLLGVGASLFCDIDVAWSGPPGTLSYLQYHRVGTHSIFFLPVVLTAFALLHLLVRNKVRQPVTTGKVLVISGLAFVSHLVLDLIPPYGVALLFPFSEHRFSIDLLHDLDIAALFISITAIGCLTVTTLKQNHWQQHAAIASVALFVLYIGFMSAWKRSYTLTVKELLQNNNITSQPYIIPRPFWRWKAVVDHEDRWKVFLTKDPTDFESWKRMSASRLTPPIDHPAIRVYQRFARFPAIIQYTDTLVVYSNLAYSVENYQLRLYMDTEGNVVRKVVTSYDLEWP